MNLTFSRICAWWFYLVVLITPFVFTWVNEELFEFNKMLVIYGLSVVIAATWLIKMIWEKRWGWQSTWLDLPIGLWLGSQILSTLFSIHIHTSIFGYYTRFHGGLLSSLSYVCLFVVFTSLINRSQLWGWLTALLVGGVGVAIYAVPEHFGVSLSCLFITGQANVSCWIQDVQARIFGTFGQPNWLAAYAISLIPVALAVMVIQVKRRHWPWLGSGAFF